MRIYGLLMGWLRVGYLFLSGKGCNFVPNLIKV